MSRSYKKHPFYKCKITKGKHFAKRAVRRYTGDIKSGMQYKRLYCSWAVIDYTVKAEHHRHEAFQKIKQMKKKLLTEKLTEEEFNNLFNEFRWFYNLALLYHTK